MQCELHPFYQGVYVHVCVCCTLICQSCPDINKNPKDSFMVRAVRVRGAAAYGECVVSEEAVWSACQKVVELKAWGRGSTWH